MKLPAGLGQLQTMLPELVKRFGIGKRPKGIETSGDYEDAFPELSSLGIGEGVPYDFPAEPRDDIMSFLGLGGAASDIPYDPERVMPPAPPGPPSERDQIRSRLTQQQGKFDDILSVLGEAPPAPTEAKINPIEQLAELWAVSQGGATNAGGAYSLAANRAQMADAAAMRQYEGKFAGAKASLPYVAADINNLLDRETALDQIDARIKQAELTAAAKQAALAVKAQKDVRFKIGDLMARGQASVPAVAQVLLATGADPEMANATAEEIMRDVAQNPMSWHQQHQADKLEAAQTKATDADSFKRNKEDNDIIQDLGSTLAQKIAAVGRLQQAGQLPMNADPVTLAQELSLEAKESMTRAALSSERTETEKIRGDILKTELKYLPQELRDKHARNLAQITHWENMDRLAAKMGDFQMVKDARDNIIQRYAKALDAFGSDIISIDKDIQSIMIDRRQALDARDKIITKGFRKDGHPIAADAKDQPDLDRLVRRIDNADALLVEKRAQKQGMSGDARKLRTKMDSEGIEQEVNRARREIELDAPQTTTPAVKTDIDALRKKYKY